MADIVGRGFKDYQDFKNQLDAIDLGLVPENQNELSDSGLSDGLDYSEEANLVLNKLMNFLYLGKQGIIKDPELSFEYAKTLGRRFEEGEKAIVSSSSNLIYEYWNILNKNKGLNEKEKLPEILHNRMILYGMDNDYYAKLYLRSISKTTEADKTHLE